MASKSSSNDGCRSQRNTRGQKPNRDHESSRASKPEDTNRCCIRTEMDYLVMVNYLLEKKEQPQFLEGGDSKMKFKVD